MFADPIVQHEKVAIIMIPGYRDMMFKVLAVERPDIRVINWAPGPMPTQMVDDIIQEAICTIFWFSLFRSVV